LTLDERLNAKVELGKTGKPDEWAAFVAKMGNARKEKASS
jgi:hypothetical protein